VPISFPSFAEQVRYELYNQTCYSSPDEAVKEQVDAFSQRCGAILGCEYQAARHSCGEAATAPLARFELFVNFCFVTMFVKELAKVLCVVWCLSGTVVWCPCISSWSFGAHLRCSCCFSAKKGATGSWVLWSSRARPLLGAGILSRSSCTKWC
jgi:hypothetical protein